MHDKKPILFSTTPYSYLADELCKLGGFARGEVETRTFPDGERYIRVRSQVAGRKAIVVGGTISDGQTLELYDLSCGVVQCGASSLSMVVPYFGYSTMERAVQPGEVVTAKTRARLLSTVPLAYNANRVILLDLHTDGIAHYFEGHLHTEHLSARELVVEEVRALGHDDIVVGCTDAGRAKWVQKLANDLGVRASFVIKQRLSGDETEVMAVAAHVEDRTVVIYDDMIRTGGSLLGAARAYREAGARKIYAIATHAVLPGRSIEKLEESGLFEAILCTDSHPRACEHSSSFLRVKSIARLFATHLTRGRAAS